VQLLRNRGKQHPTDLRLQPSARPPLTHQPAASGAGYDAPMQRPALMLWLAACAMPPGAAGKADGTLLMWAPVRTC
jgi:hypothetical protein